LEKTIYFFFNLLEIVQVSISEVALTLGRLNHCHT